MKIIYDDSGKIISFTQFVTNNDLYILAPHWFTIEDITKYKIVEKKLIKKIPESVTPRQAKLALFNVGLLSQVESAIESIQDEVIKNSAKIEWNNAEEFRRDWPLLNSIASELNINKATLDALFISASKL